MENSLEVEEQSIWKSSNNIPLYRYSPTMKTNNITIAAEPFYFEKTITPNFVRYFFGNYWHYSIYMCIIYLMTIKILQHHMKGRPPYNLKVAFTIWNGLLATYSICSTFRAIPVLYEAFERLTFYEIVCDKSLTENSPVITFSTTVFVFSKVWELGDTIFIVLNKRNLMFLHCYHHASMVIFSCYFTLKCMEIKIFPIVAMMITVIQIIQMIFGFLITCRIYWLQVNGYTCDSPLEVLKFCLLLSISYVYLFIDLFYKSYVKKYKANKKEE
ncbi:putative fatty acid elongase 4 [Centruroides vittatus]|uniref:putative fatty acid elongase 4 n=1 Tax=Centruroides vittatus TaxID=120091 RepID=UPI00350F3D30